MSNSELKAPYVVRPVRHDRPEPYEDWEIVGTDGSGPVVCGTRNTAEKFCKEMNLAWANGASWALREAQSIYGSI